MAKPILVFEAEFELADTWWESKFYQMVAKWRRSFEIKDADKGITSNVAMPVLPLVAVTNYITFSCYYISFRHAGLTAGFCLGHIAAHVFAKVSEAAPEEE